MQNNPQEKNNLDGEQTPVSSGKHPHTLGWITLFVIFGILGVWAVLAQIETAVQASGKVITKGYKKAIQHPRGGIVTKLHFKEGQHVEKGQAILELDRVQILSQLNTAIAQHDDLLLQKARLEAESNLSDKADFDAIRSRILDQKRASKLLKKEKALFESNRRRLQDQIRLLLDKNKILAIQNEGLEEEISSNKRQLASYQKELKKWQSLYDRNMTDELKVLDRKRQVEQIRARIIQNQSKIRENEATINANKNQIELTKSDFMNKAQKKLKEVTLKLETLNEKIKALRNANKRQTISAPDSGVITDMSIHSAGEVVIPNKPIAFVVPKKDKLVLEMMIKPTDIDKVHVGQKAEIRFPSYVDPAALPVDGNVTYVSADTIQPPGSKVSFYKALIEITPAGMKAIKINQFQIVPGMPASAYIKAGKRSFLSYILLPLEQLVRGAFHAN